MKNKKSWKRGRQQFMKNLNEKLKLNIKNEQYNKNLDYNSDELKFMPINDIKNKKIIYELTEGEELFLRFLEISDTVKYIPLGEIFNNLERLNIFE